MVTPLLGKLRKDGGTLYTFSSAARDLTKIFTDNRYEFTFSHFACLNLPDIKLGTMPESYSSESESGENEYVPKYTYLEQLGCKVDKEQADEGMNTALAENLQNYVMNFETAILNGVGDNEGYTGGSQIRTVSERVFFNWLKKIGAIRFKESSEYSSGVIYVEPEDFEKKTIKYIGKIDIINSVDVLGDAYDEIYLHIPGSVGGTDNVKFYAIKDQNYDGKTREITNKDDIEKIFGRKNIENPSPYGLSIKPIFDNLDSNGNGQYIEDEGFTINFNEEFYGELMYNNNQSSLDFEFNCVLLYYTMRDNSAGSNGIAVTNLYGVLFLDNITSINQDDGDDAPKGYIQRYPKIAGGQSGNGNSYALKVDLKIDTLPDTTMTAKDYDNVNGDYAGALEIYSRALLQMQSLATKIISDKQEIAILTQRIEFLEQQLELINRIPYLDEKVDSLNDIITYGDPVIDGKNILDLIELNSTRLDALINGKTNAKIEIDANIIKGGDGIEITKGDNDIVITSKTPNISFFYKDSELKDENILNGNNDKILNLNTEGADNNIYTQLYGDSDNICVLYADGICNANLNLNLLTNDGFYWKSGRRAFIKIKHKTSFVGSQTKANNTSAPILNIYINNVKLNSHEVLRVDKLNGLYEIEILCINEEASEPQQKFIYELKTK